ncbi:acyltransferase [Sphingomonas aliaeris]|uniref:Acyltransferase n=1 Tax=Sphingomonas aliaeris TaxID=2759526 RepID=A0A974NSV8_9SPHN|nr:acyltransferase [Sphingomonas aliaeris]QQV76355.1 acyltransferase [Sphingomonas aliaeris]
MANLPPVCDLHMLGVEMTLGKRFDACKGVGPGFDHLRVGLSLAILFWHSFGLAYGMEWTRSLPVWPFKPLLAALLPMFFALSGILVIGSAIRLRNLRTFITFRVLRILPALFTEVSLSALVFGPLLTAVPLATYFTSSEFYEYFGSFIGRVRYVLPGLFLTNPVPRVVNGALWTVGPEILCYLLLSILILTRAYNKPRWMLFLTACFAATCMAFDPFEPGVIREILPTRALILAFLSGNLIFLFRDKLPFSRPLAAVVFGVCVLAISVTQTTEGYLFLIYPAAACLAYVVAVIGFSGLPPLPFFHRGDYSYGIYIYGYPIQQAIVHFLPAYRNGWFVFAAALPVTLLCAIASWHLIEKPVLGWRKRLLPAQSAPSQSIGPVIWDRRRVAAIAGLGAYALFVVFAANIFPVRKAAKWMLGRPDAPIENVRPQF